MSFSKRLSKKRFEFRLTQEELSKQLGVTRAAVNMWENPPSEEIFPNSKNLKKLCTIFGVSEVWMRFGEVQEKRLELQRDELIISGPPILRGFEINEWLLSKQSLLIREVSVTMEEKTKDYFQFTVDGDSMISNSDHEKSIFSGEIALVDTSAISDIKSGDIVLAQFGSLSDNYKMRIYNKDGSDAYLCPLNPRYSQTLVNENVRIVGKVIRLHKNVA